MGYALYNLNKSESTEEEATRLNEKLQSITKLLSGDDFMAYIGNDTNNTLISGKNDQDSISNGGSNVTIDAGAGNDYVYNYGTNVSINGGDGDDTIYNDEESYSNVTVGGGKGNDVIYLNDYVSNVIEYAAGDGNDTIYGYNGNTTIQTSGAGSQVTFSGDDIVIKVGDGTLTLVDADVSDGLHIVRMDASTVEAEPAPESVSRFIEGTADDEVIENTVAGATVAALGGDDTVWSFGDNSSIDAGKGNDNIQNISNNSTINGGDGADIIYNYKTVYVDDQRFDGVGDHVSINGGEKDDEIYNHGSNVTIHGGSGNDILVNYDFGNREGEIVTDEEGKSVTLDGGLGNDTIANFSTNVSIQGGKGDDSILVGDEFGEGGAYTTTAGGKGNDTIVLDTDAKNNLIQYADGDGNDFISGFNVTTTLQISGSYSTAVSGTDLVISVGEGNITLEGATSLKTVNINDTVINPRLITLSEGADTYHNSLTKATVKALGGNDYLSNIADNVTVDAGKGHDTIYNDAANVKITAGDGNDSIKNDTVALDDGIGSANPGRYVTIDAGKGNDTITSCGADNVSINAGAGDDIINGDLRTSTTVIGGTGNDTIYGSNYSKGMVIQYSAGDGFDSVIGFKATDTLQIGNGTTDTYSSIKSGKDVIVTVGRDEKQGKITLVGAADKALNINGIFKGEGSMEVNRENKKNWSGTELKDTLYNYASTVTAKGGADDDLISTMRKTTAVKIYGEAGDDTLEAYNATKVTLSGGSGDDEIYSSGSQIVINGGTGNDLIEIESKKTQIQYKAGDGNDTIEGFDSDDTLKIGNGTTDTYSAQVVGDDIVLTVGRDENQGTIVLVGAGTWLTFDNNATSLPHIAGTHVSSTVHYDDSTTTPAVMEEGIKTADASARTAAIRITGNALANSIVDGAGKDVLYGGDGDDTIDGGANNDKIYGQDGDDSLIGGAGADTLWGGDGEDTLDGGAGNDRLIGDAGADTFIYSGGKDIIADYVSGEDVVSLVVAGVSYDEDNEEFVGLNASISGENVVLKINNSNTLTIQNAKHQELTIDVNGKELTTIVGAKFFNNDTTTPVTMSNYDYADASKRTTKAIEITGNANDNTIIGGTKNDTLYGGAGNDNLSGNAGNDKLYGEAGNDELNGGAGADVLYGGDGDDTLIGGKGKDYLKGEDGADVFVFQKGDQNNIIVDYTAGEDKISLGADMDNYTVTHSGDNIVLSVGTDSLTIQKSWHQEITFISSNNAEYVQRFDALIVDNNSPTTVNVSADYEYVDATARTKAVRIIANDLDNTIEGGSGKNVLYGGEGQDYLVGGKTGDSIHGDDGDDTLIGGKGNDSLWGDEGADTFVYNAGDGKDIIIGYDSDDNLELNGLSVDDLTVNTNDADLGNITFNIDTNNSITLSKYTSNYFRINGSSYKISGTSLVKRG